jgi:protein-S-isoprenylcysteine O-methyltransferase Ste14
MIAGFWPSTAIYFVWYFWGATWIAAAVWANRTVKRAGLAREWRYRLIALTGFVLLFAFPILVTNGHWHFGRSPGILGLRVWPYPPLPVGWTLVVVAALSIAFVWWARLYLGRLWSGSITRKEEHRVVDTGPYALVRHPIYTGLLTAAVATAIVVGELHTVLGALLLIIAYWMKARLEERFLREELGPEAYDSYRRRVPMLVPFGPKLAA